MFRLDRVIPAAALLALGLSLSACSSSGGNFDPTEWIPDDMFGAKVKLAGERKPVFPEGVPGVPQGVPPEMLKGNQQATLEPPAVIAAEPAPPPRPQASKPPPKPRTASAPPRPAPARPAAAQPTSDQAAAPWPEQAPAQRPPSSQGRGANWPDAGTQANWPPPDPGSFSR